MPRPSPEQRFNTKDIDDLLLGIEEAATALYDTSDVDDLLEGIGESFEERKKEIAAWPLERRRKEAVNSTDELVLEVLSRDPVFAVRTLVAVNPQVSEAIRLKMVEEGNEYQRMVVAHHPRNSSYLLQRIGELSSDPRTHAVVLGHANLSPITRFHLERRTQS